ncbi:MAG: hypothetical protein JSW60_06400 [Thermoplasmatales archaeon]|nr:MAG: hypothetical protein JSW60_06400 [Thermoplasmatales archaeon]
MPYKIPTEKVQKIREEVLKGKSKYQVALELDVSFDAVYKNTEDIPNKRVCNSGIRGPTLELLKQLHRNGYIISRRNSPLLHTLKRHFPEIQLIRVRFQHVCFLKGFEKVALRAFLEKEKFRVVSYHKLAPVCRAFGVDLPLEEKRDLLGLPKKEEVTRRSFRVIDKFQKRLDDFYPENTFACRSELKKPQKFHVIDYDSLLRDDELFRGSK